MGSLTAASDQVEPVVDPGELVTQLSEGLAWGEAGRPVEVIETHISWVFLTPRYAYKLRKPVQYEFLDFSTCALRKADCLAEVELNQRLAPHVYLGVYPLARDSRGAIRLNGKGETVEWVVKMRRLAAADALDQHIAKRTVTPAEVARIAEHLTEFYNRLPPLPLLTEDYRQHLEHHVRGNQAALLDAASGLDRRIVRRVHAAQLRLVRLYPEMIESRVCDGRIVEGHGDLRPEHIYLTPTPVVIDCVEFRREFREIDVLDELCFLAMECERLGAAYIGKQILDYYCRVSADRPPAALALLYRAYRACVRAKVHVLRARQLSGVQRSAAQGDARDYLQLADRYAARLGPPVMLLVRGRSGTGKSTLAAALAESLALEYLTTDVIRQELFGTAQAAAFQQGSYTPENRQRVYDVLAQRARDLLSSGVSVVVDGTFLTRASRRPLLEAAQQHRAVNLILECTCPLPVAQQRIASRRAAGPQPSDAWPELAALQAEHEELDLPTWSRCHIDTQAELAEMIARVQGRLREELDRRSSFPQ